MDQSPQNQQKKSARGGSQPKTDRPLDRAFGRKKLGYRTPKRFLRNVFRRKVTPNARPRSLGGHR